MQKFLRHSRKWSALMIGLIVTTLLSILVVWFLEKSLRLGANAKSIEHSVQAYYLATGEIERKLQNLGPDLKKQPWIIQWGSRQVNHFSSVSVDVSTKSNIVPKAWFGNSPFDKNYNIISLDRPVQLVVGEGIDWNNASIEWRLPKTVKSGDNYISPLVLDDSNEVILWSFGNAGKNISAEGAGLFKSDDIWETHRNFWNKNGVYYEDASIGILEKKNDMFQNFYNSIANTSCANYSCTLKFSMLRPVKSIHHGDFPYLEYKLVDLNKEIPLQFMTLDATGYVGDYTRKRSVQIPQITTNAALDFAVLQ